MIQQQRTGDSVAGAARRVVSTYGLRGLYRGFVSGFDPAPEDRLIMLAISMVAVAHMHSCAGIRASVCLCRALQSCCSSTCSCMHHMLTHGSSAAGCRMSLCMLATADTHDSARVAVHVRLPGRGPGAARQPAAAAVVRGHRHHDRRRVGWPAGSHRLAAAGHHQNTHAGAQAAATCTPRVSACRSLHSLAGCIALVPSYRQV